LDEDIYKMTAQRVTYTLDSNLESVNHAEAVAVKIATETGFEDEQVQEIGMAVREATVNAVLHGNAYDPGKKVRISFERRSGMLEVTVSDEGKGFDAASIPDPLAPENILKQSGRGIFLIRTYMDEVSFRDLQPGTEMKLIKHVRGATADAKEKTTS
jgi:serine/threonine-protein kinase RsbW